MMQIVYFFNTIYPSAYMYIRFVLFMSRRINLMYINNTSN